MMTHQYLLIFLILCLQLFSIGVSKRGGGSRGGGGSSSGGGVGGGTGGAPSGGGFGGGNRGSQGTFSGGSNIGGSRSGGFMSSRTSQMVVAGLAGAAIGAGAYHIISSSHPYYRSPDTGVTYYYGDQYYKPQSGRITCSKVITENDTQLQNLKIDNTTKVEKIVYDCDLRTQMCCNGLECCPRQVLKREEKKGMPWWAGLLLCILFVSFFACLGYFIFKRVKKASGSTYSDRPDATYVTTTTTYNDPSTTMYNGPGPPQNQYPTSPGVLYPNQQQAYYPPAPTYGAPVQHPQAPYPQQAYPQQPPSYGWPQQQAYGQQ